MGLWNGLLFAAPLGAYCALWDGAACAAPFVARPALVGWVVAKGLLDNVVADLLWAKAVVLTSPTFATVALNLTVPLGFAADALRGDLGAGAAWTGGGAATRRRARGGTRPRRRRAAASRSRPYGSARSSSTTRRSRGRP